MTIQAFELRRGSDKGRTFVSGLFWQPLTNKKDFRKEIRRLADEMKFDLAVWRQGEIMQVGFASAKEQARSGHMSAAAIVSKTISMEDGASDFLCATQVPDGRWLYVAQRDGVLLPDGDLLGSEDEIRARMLADYSLGGSWGRIIAPVHWGMPANEDREFLAFLPTKKNKIVYHRWWAMTPVRVGIGSAIRKTAPFIVLGMVALGGVYGWKLWQQKQAEKVAMEAALAAQAAEQARAAAALAKKPWQDAPRAPDLAAACMSAMADLPVDVAGWRAEMGRCNTTSLVVTWKRDEYARVGAFTAAYPVATVDLQGESASLLIPLKVQPGGADEAIAMSDAVERVLDRARTLGLKVGITDEALPALPGGQAQAASPWKSVKWGITASRLTPDSVLSHLDGPAFRANQLEFTLKDGVMVWKMEGVQYAKTQQ